jgi:hypothetical protein
MKKIFLSKSIIGIFLGIALITIYSCKKEYSFEGSNDPKSNVVIGNDCRINKIAFADNQSDVGIGSVSAEIDALDATTSVTLFDSLANAAIFNAAINYVGDKAFINADEYFVLEINTNRITRLHSLLDPDNPASPQVDVDYTYDGAGHLAKKSYSFTLQPNTPFQEVNYTYTNGNLTGMAKTDLINNDLLQDAVLEYYPAISPKNYIYLFADEESSYAPFNQFFNFGTKSTNAVKSVTITSYDPGNVPTGSTLSTFDNYILSQDNYVISATITGDDLFCIPAPAGKIKLSYKCK